MSPCSYVRMGELQLANLAPEDLFQLWKFLIDNYPVGFVAARAISLAAYVGLRPSKSTPAAATAAASQPVATPLAPARNLEPPALVNEPEPTTFKVRLPRPAPAGRGLG